MTLTDCEESASCNTSGDGMQPTLVEQESLALGVALREAVWQAQEQGRLHCGVMQCARLLEIDPFNVMMCVIPVSVPDDVSGIIERTLIEAFCHEYQIRLIKVDSVNKLRKVLDGRAEGTQLTCTSTSSSSSPSPSTDALAGHRSHPHHHHHHHQMPAGQHHPDQATPPSLACASRPPNHSRSSGVDGEGGDDNEGASSPPLWELCSCVLVQYPESGEASEEEETVAHHYKMTTSTSTTSTSSLVGAGFEDGSSVFVALPDD